MKKNKPLVSFIVPCFNQTKMIYEAVSSIMLSYTGPKEIIIVNDFSDESGWESRLNEIVRIFPKVVIINHPENKGLSAARNTGINACTGEFVQFLDSDDFLTPNKIEYQLIHFNIVKNLSISVSDYLLCDDTVTFFYESEPCIGSFVLNLEDFLFKWERGLSIPIHCGLFRQEILKNTCFDERLKGKEDWVFWCKVSLEKKKIGFLNFYGAIYRQHKNAMTKKDNQRMGNSWLEASQIINDMIGEQNKTFLSSALLWHKQYYDN